MNYLDEMIIDRSIQMGRNREPQPLQYWKPQQALLRCSQSHKHDVNIVIACIMNVCVCFCIIYLLLKSIDL